MRILSRALHAIGVALIMACLLAGAYSRTLAQEAGTDQPAPPTPPELAGPTDEGQEDSETAQEDDVVKIEHADLLQYEADKEMYYLSGSVAFSHKDMKMYCDEAWYDEANDTALAAANFNTEVATLTGNITVVAQKKVEEVESSGDEEEKPSKFEEYRRKKTTITCPKIVYEYNDDVKKMTLSGPVKAVQEDKTAWAEAAVYEELTDIVTLTGNVSR